MLPSLSLQQIGAGTSQQIIGNIETQGRIVSAALAKLAALMAAELIAE